PAVMLYSLWHVGISPRPPRRRRSPGQLRRPNGPPLNGRSRGGPDSVRRVGAASFNAGPLHRATEPARSGSAVVPVLAPGLVDGDRRGVGQVQRPHPRTHRDAHPLGDHRVPKDLLRQSGGFGAKQQHVAVGVGDLAEVLLGMPVEGVVAVAAVGEKMLDGGGPVAMYPHVGQVVVVQAGAAQLGVAQVEPEWFDQVQHHPGHRREPDRVTGVRRDARLVEDDVEHQRRVPPQPGPAAGSPSSCADEVKNLCVLAHTVRLDSDMFFGCPFVPGTFPHDSMRRPFMRRPPSSDRVRPRRAVACGGIAALALSTLVPLSAASADEVTDLGTASDYGAADAPSGLQAESSPTGAWFVQTAGTPSVQGGSVSTNSRHADAAIDEADDLGLDVDVRETYSQLWTGFSAEMSDYDAAALAEADSVQAVFPVLTVSLPPEQASST